MISRMLRGVGHCIAGVLACAPGCASDPADDESGGEFGFATGPLMRPGEDCEVCHGTDTDYPTAPRWSLAGTVYPSADATADQGIAGVSVIVSDAAGQEAMRLVTNAVGNFYSSEVLPQPYFVALEYQGERIEMPCPPPSGGCAKCHRRPPNGFAPGRLFIPQAQSAPPAPFDCDTWMPR